MSPPSDRNASGGGEPLPPSSSLRIRRGLYLALAHVPALIPAAFVASIVVVLILASGLAPLPHFFSFQFDNTRDEWGIGAFVVGSFLTAVPALILSMGIGLGVAIASTTYLPRIVARSLDPFVDLLAGIPSVVFGLWAYIVVGPYFGLTINPWLAEHLAFLPWFGPPPGSQLGIGLPLSIFILTIMALPITTLLIRDALRSVPRELWESGLALGATRWEVVRRVVLPYSQRGVASAAFLGFGRAFGETVAVAIVIGSVSQVPVNFYGVGDTMAAAIFQLTDAAFGNSQFLTFLAELAFVLFAITLVVNIVGRRLISSLAQFEVAGL